MTTVVIGVGNPFRHDDGAGAAVVAALAGLHRGEAQADALAEVQADALADARLEVCDGEPTRLIELWSTARLAIVVDAAAADPASGRRPGDVLRWEMWRAPEAAPPSHAAPHSGNATGAQPQPDSAGSAQAPPPAPPAVAAADSPGTHGLGPGTAVELAAVLDRLPEHLVVLAVVGSDFRPGPGLSAPVAAAVARLAPQVAAEVGP